MHGCYEYILGNVHNGFNCFQYYIVLNARQNSLLVSSFDQSYQSCSLVGRSGWIHTFLFTE